MWLRQVRVLLTLAFCCDPVTVGAFRTNFVLQVQQQQQTMPLPFASPATALAVCNQRYKTAVSGVGLHVMQQ